ncbi:MAG: metal ABC transporter substrate-binding protein [Deltaproteobacteria bacterium]|jgi:ABC-type Zn uptake system ZnuABC Zn-binding protein ZnuA|nr:metal ABC transporter substrate-binding protein [Deltaproteobacteria bacterium]
MFRGIELFKCSLKTILIFTVVFSLILVIPSPRAKAVERLVCASYPVWLFTRYLNEGRDIYQVELLTNPATGCPHEFAPTPKDLERLTQTKVLVKNGLGLESYLDRALKVAPPDIDVIDASAGIPTLSLFWGRLDFDGSLSRTADSQAAMTPNPHIFLSPAISITMMSNIAAALSRLDPGGADHYASRLAKWELELQSIIEDITRFRETHRGYKLVTSHGFMDYLAQDLGLTILADISPIGSEAPPSAQRLQGLIKLITGERISAILLDPEADPNVGRTLSKETKVPAAILDSATAGSFDPPIDFYQQVLREDIELLGKLFPANATPPPSVPKPKAAPHAPKPIEPPVLD